MVLEIEQFEKFVIQKCKELKLTTIYNYEIEGKNSLEFFSDVVRSKNRLKEFEAKFGFDGQFYNDFMNISYNMEYFIALCSIYQPYINNEFADEVYIQNMYDYRYLMYINIGIQFIYNFWDRVGDLLEYFYEVEFKSNKKTFGLVIDKLKGSFTDSENYKFLKNFKDTKYQEVLEIRHRIVHKVSLDAGHYGEFTSIRMSDKSNYKPLLETHYKKKINYLKILKEHFNLFNIGYEKMLKLIDELPDKN